MTKNTEKDTYLGQAGDDKPKKYFQMQIAYHSLSRALKLRGWIEVSKHKFSDYGQQMNLLNSNGTCSPSRRFISSEKRDLDSLLDLKFSLNTQDIHFHNLKKGCFIN